ncbi:MAG: dockerin type I repeat-containing protein, partial [Defluviitaleaceae bacterium]|nr:dockerin type I repeat-containing protein [Defluviitaleaceae bacterium]
MMKLKARKAFALLLSFLMVFSIAINPAFAHDSNDCENLQWENGSEYFSFIEDAEFFAELKSEEPGLATTAIEPFTTAPNTRLGLDGFLTGDVGNTGRITSAGATLLARYLIVGDVPICIRAADINRDGRLEIADLILLQRMLVGLAPAEPPGNLIIL